MTHGYESPMQFPQIPTGPSGTLGWDPDDHIWKPGGATGFPAGGATGQVLTKRSGADGDVVWQTPAPPIVKMIVMNTGTITIPPNVLTDITFTEGIFVNTAAGWITFTPPSLTCTVLQTAFYRFTAFVDWGNESNFGGTYRSSAIRRNANQDLDPFIGLPPVTSPGVDTVYSWSIVFRQTANATFGMRVLHDATAPLTRVICSMAVEVVGT